MTAYLSPEELAQAGFARVGEDVKVSRWARFYSPQTVELGSHIRIDDFVIVTAPLEITGYTHIPPFCALVGREPISFKAFAGLSWACFLFTSSDDYSGMSLMGPTIPVPYKLGLKHGPIVLGEHAVLGARTTIMPGCSIGAGVRTGVGTFVRESLTPWTLYAGVPAKPLRQVGQGCLDLATDLLEAERALVHYSAMVADCE